MASVPESDSSHRDSRGCLIERLQRQLGRAGVAAQDWITPAADLEIFSSTVAALDRLLPGGGLRHGMLVEWLAESAGSGTATLSLLAAREACRQGGVLVVIDGEKTFYPPAAAAWGIDLARLIVVHPQTARDALWAAVQALRSPVVAAMWSPIDRLDSRAFRRLQLAAQAGRTLGLLLRPASVRGQPSWADVQLWAKCPLPIVHRPLHHGPRTTDHGRHVQIHVLRLRGARPGGRVTLEIDDAAHSVQEVIERVPLLACPAVPTIHDAHSLPVVTQLADPAAAAVSARA